MKIYNILAIDDDPNFIKLLHKKLDGAYFKVTATTNVKSFFRLYSNHKWDFCLVDLNLEEGQEVGFKVVRYLRNNLKSTIPILIISASDQKEKIAHGIECGASDYITKPLDLDLFKAKVQYLFDEDIEFTTSLKTTTVPVTYRECTVTTRFIPHALSEEGITLVSANNISKGTMVEIKNSVFNDILNRDILKLMVTKNSKLNEKQYSVFLHFDDDDVELSDKARNWVVDKITNSVP